MLFLNIFQSGWNYSYIHENNNFSHGFIQSSISIAIKWVTKLINALN